MWRLIPLLSLWVACAVQGPPKSPASLQPVINPETLAKELYVQSLFWEWRGNDTLSGLFLSQAALLDTSSEFLAQKTLQFQTKISDSAAFFWARETLKRSNRHNSSAQLVLAEQFKKSGQLDSAISYLEMAYDQNSHLSLNAVQDLAIMYQIKQDYAKALRVWGNFAQKTNYPIQVVERFIQVAQKSSNDTLIKDFLNQAWTESEDPKIGQKYLELLVTEQKYDSALNLLKTLISKDSINQRRYQTVQGMIYEELHQLDSAYTVAVQLPLKSFQEIHHTALLALKMQKTSDALSWLRLIPKDSMQIENWALLSMVYRDLNQFDSALQTMKIVQSMRKNDPQIRREVWSLKSEIPRYRMALTQELEDSLRINPALIEVREYKAGLHSHWAQLDWLQGKNYKQEYAKAAQEYTSLILSQPQKVIYLFRYADILTQLQEDAKAYQMLERAYRMDTNSALAQNAYGFFLINHQQVDLGFKLIEKAWLQEPQNLAVGDSYAWAHFQKGNYPKALEIQNSLITQVDTSSVESWEYFYHLGAIQWAMRDSSALKNVNWANKRHPHRPELVNLLKLIKGVK